MVTLLVALSFRASQLSLWLHAWPPLGLLSPHVCMEPRALESGCRLAAACSICVQTALPQTPTRMLLPVLIQSQPQAAGAAPPLPRVREPRHGADLGRRRVQRPAAECCRPEGLPAQRPGCEARAGSPRVLWGFQQLWGWGRGRAQRGRAGW